MGNTQVHESERASTSRPASHYATLPRRHNLKHLQATQPQSVQNRNSTIGNGTQTLPLSYGSTFRRYYPSEYRHQRASAQFFRSQSLQLYFIPPGASEQSSPIAKKHPKRDSITTNYSFNSLPSCPEFQLIDANQSVNEYRQQQRVVSAYDPLEEVSPRTEEAATLAEVDTIIEEEDDTISLSVPANPLPRQVEISPHRTLFKKPPRPPSAFYVHTQRQGSWREAITSSSRNQSSVFNAETGSKHITKQPTPQQPWYYPNWFTQSLLGNGDSKETSEADSSMSNSQFQSKSVMNSKTLDQLNGNFSSAARIGSFRSEKSARNVHTNSLFTRLRQKTMTRKRKLTAQSVTTASCMGSSIASLNSLQDGRTPWPIPWLEAIFLPEYPNKAPVNETHFQIIGTIASGAFGKVYRVCSKSEPELIFAMKVQSKSEVISRDAIQQIKDEVSIHESVSACAFIAALYASWQSRTNLYIVLQYVLGYGDLYQLWHDVGPFSEPVIRIYAAEIALALDYVHCHGVIYRDLKMENIVLDEHGHIQLVDFGLAKWLHPGDRTVTICGTLNYMAPEIARSRAYGHAVDWWSLGTLLYVLLTGRYPFPPARDHFSLCFDDWKVPESASQPLQRLIAKLLTQEPDERLQSLHEMRQQEFFAEFSYDAIAEKKFNPYDYIPRMHKCLSCNTLTSPKDRFDTDDSYLANNFEEDYDPFSSFDYFSESVPVSGGLPKCDLSDICQPLVHLGKKV